MYHFPVILLHLSLSRHRSFFVTVPASFPAQVILPFPCRRYLSQCYSEKNVQREITFEVWCHLVTCERTAVSGPQKNLTHRCTLSENDKNIFGQGLRDIYKHTAIYSTVYIISYLWLGGKGNLRFCAVPPSLRPAGGGFARLRPLCGRVRRWVADPDPHYFGKLNLDPH